MTDKEFGILVLRAVIGVGVEDELAFGRCCCRMNEFTE